MKRLYKNLLSEIIRNSLIIFTVFAVITATVTIAQCCIAEKNNNIEVYDNSSDELINNTETISIISVDTVDDTQDVLDNISEETVNIVEEKEELDIDNIEEPVGDYLYHTIKAGESLYKISLKYYNDGNLYNVIASENNITDMDIIYPDQILKIPVIKNITVNSYELCNPITENTPITDYNIEILVQSALDNNWSADKETVTKIISYAKDITETKYTNVPLDLILSIIDRESDFIPNVINSDSTCYGLTQIHKINHKWISNTIGQSEIYDKKGSSMFLDYKVAVEAGCLLLSNLIEKYGTNDNYHSVIMAYSGGEGYLKRKNKDGIFSSEYSKEIVSYMANRY